MKASKKPSKRAAALSDSDDSDDNADVEEAYAARTKSKPAPRPMAAKVDAPSDSEGSDSDDPDAPPPVHESLLPKKEKRDRGRKKDKVRYVPPGETREQRDSRTIFVGNVPVEVVKSKVRLEIMYHIRIY